MGKSACKASCQNPCTFSLTSSTAKGGRGGGNHQTPVHFSERERRNVYCAYIYSWENRSFYQLLSCIPLSNFNNKPKKAFFAGCLNALWTRSWVKFSPGPKRQHMVPPATGDPPQSAWGPGSRHAHGSLIRLKLGTTPAHFKDVQPSTPQTLCGLWRWKPAAESCRSIIP